MGKLLIEYNGRPTLVEYHFDNIETVKFIVVHKSEYLTYKENEFNTAEEAYEYSKTIDQTIGQNKLLYFLSITSTDQKNGNIEVINKPLRINNTSISLAEVIDVRHGSVRTLISFDARYIQLLGNYYGKEPHFKIIYKRANQSFELLDSFYELIPKYEDIFKEIMFIKDVLESSGAQTQNDIEAYFFQAKQKIEESQLPLPESSSVDILIRTKKGNNMYLIVATAIIAVIFMLLVLL